MSENEYWSENVYYNPELCGMRIVASWDFGESYEFDITVIFQDINTGKYYMAKDSGCSCPVPFEDFHSLADLTPIDKNDVKRIAIEMEGRPKNW